jgi:Fe2+ or Zn2+ uptake regulation protein
MIILLLMDMKYQILHTLAQLVKEAPQPTQYQCLPRQLILLSSFDWATIYLQLQLLEEEGLVQIVMADNIQFSITQEGIEKVNAFELANKQMIRG